MKLAVQTRRAVEADVPALIDLAQRSWLSGNCEMAPIEAVRDWITDDFESTRYPEIWHKVTVAEHGSRILGLTSTDGREVADLWVHPSFQRRGIGSILLRVAEEEIQLAGHHTARLCYTEYNVAAPRFYRTHGYTKAGRSPETLPCGIVRDVVVMEKKLNS
ncbi:MAG: GNAT family N-acetyltransferase [Gemmatimonadota bacterium]|nr:GNAT family N-acetyltransferase [Gemmatimonadota bacterium]